MSNITSENLLAFIKNSPSAFHSILSIVKVLNREGFIRLDENENFNLTNGSKYYVIRNDSSIIAFKIGEELDNYAFNIVASHSDCPSFKIKQIEQLKGEYNRLNVEGYGGMLCATWFDRPLNIAGRVIVKENNKLVSKFVNFNRNVASIPSVAIHFNRQANDNATYSLATDMFPTISLNNKPFKEILANELNVNADSILQHDLYLINHQDGYFWGLDDEYISSPKLDDLQCAYTTLLGFIKSNNKHNISVYCCFDNEEVGSTTRQGANSNFLDTILNRINTALNKNSEDFYRALANSFMISADNAHAVHPNRQEFTDSENKVYMNKGIVIKFNASQSYTSDSLSSSIFTKICENVNVPVQYFSNKSGIRGGSTLGNISNSHVSILSVDIGLAQLAMHSACETSGTIDNEYMVSAIKEFYSSVILFNKNEVTIAK
mgnify:FL=1